VPTRLTLWPPCPLPHPGRPRAHDPPFPLDSDCRVYARARQGLWNGVAALGLTEGDVVLAPAYHQGAEIEAFARAGLTCRFYDTNEALAPDPRTLDGLRCDRTRALHIIHYWGFAQDSARWRDWCDERGLLLIEDGAQALLTRHEGTPVGVRADLAVFCLYKSFGLPDGGAVHCVVPLPEPGDRPPVGLRGLVRRLGSAVAQRSAVGAAVHGRLRAFDPTTRPFGQFLPGEYELGDPSDPPSRVTTWLLHRVVRSEAAPRRRDHYSRLLEKLAAHVPGPFLQLRVGDCPIAFPVETTEPHALARHLAAEGIDTGFLWPTWHPSLRIEEYPVARRFRERVLALPVHQELTDADVERVAAAALAWMGTG